jgi:hypothetical protein
MAQMREFFGILPGQTGKDFLVELRALSDSDKQEFAALLTAAGFPCDPPAAAAA